MVPRLVVFDLAGTTVRDRGEVLAAFLAAFQQHGSPIAADAFARWRGASKRQAIREILAATGNGQDPWSLKEKADQVYDTFREELTRRFRATADLAFADALPTFERLRASGIRIALNTGFDRLAANAVLDGTQWPPDLFDAIVTSDDVEEGRPAPDMILMSMEAVEIHDAARVAVIGDTRLDLEAAMNAGAAWRIGVLTGAHDRVTLEQGPYTHIVGSVGEIGRCWS